MSFRMNKERRETDGDKQETKTKTTRRRRTRERESCGVRHEPFYWVENRLPEIRQARRFVLPRSERFHRFKNRSATERAFPSPATRARELAARALPEDGYSRLMLGRLGCVAQLIRPWPAAKHVTRTVVFFEDRMLDVTVTNDGVLQPSPRERRFFTTLPMLAVISPRIQEPCDSFTAKATTGRFAGAELWSTPAARRRGSHRGSGLPSPTWLQFAIHNVRQAFKPAQQLAGFSPKTANVRNNGRHLEGLTYARTIFFNTCTNTQRNRVAMDRHTFNHDSPNRHQYKSCRRSGRPHRSVGQRRRVGPRWFCGCMSPRFATVGLWF